MRRNWIFIRLCTRRWWDSQEMLSWEQIWCLTLKTESSRLKFLVWISWLMMNLRHGWLRWTIILVCSYRVLYWQGSYRTWLRMRSKLLSIRCFLLLWTYQNLKLCLLIYFRAISSLWYLTQQTLKKDSNIQLQKIKLILIR